jgi:hypothetical protein
LIDEKNKDYETSCEKEVAATKRKEEEGSSVHNNSQ